MRSCSGLRVQLISESTVDAGLRLAVVEVDVHLGVAKGAATTITRHLEMTKLGMIPYGGKVNNFVYITLNYCSFQVATRYKWSKEASQLTSRVATILIGTSWIKSWDH